MPNQYSIRRSTIRAWARNGQLTPERIAQIEAAVKRGQVIDDVSKLRGTIPRTPSADDTSEVETGPASPSRAGNELAGSVVVGQPW